MKKKYEELYLELFKLEEQDVLTGSEEKDLKDNWYDETEAPDWW